jgi:membrane associated rhomboid family serine protease
MNDRVEKRVNVWVRYIKTLIWECLLKFISGIRILSNAIEVYSVDGGNVAYAAHLIGFAVGIPFGLAWSKNWLKNFLITIALLVSYFIIVFFLIPIILNSIN